MYYFRLIKTIFVLNLCFVFVHDVYSQSGSEAHNGSKRNSKYKVAVCDWMILKRQKIGEFELAKQLGADGIELDMGSLGQRDSFDNKLRKPDFQLLFKQKIKETGVEIASVAMSGFYAQSLATRKNYMALIQDCLNTMQAMGVKTAFLPLGVQCDLQLHPELRNVVVERLKVIGGMAEKAGVVIGIETSLSAAEEVKLLHEIDSKGIRIYFNFANALTNNRNLYTELKTLGKSRICQIHCTDVDEVLLQDNKRLDMKRVKQTLDKMGWKGWLVVERSRDVKDVHNIKLNYGSNIRYLHSVFTD